jgi:hypothetical protein
MKFAVEPEAVEEAASISFASALQIGQRTIAVMPAFLSS